MTAKKVKLGLLCLTLAGTVGLFVQSIVKVIAYFSNPLAFSFLQLFWTIALFFGILGHFAVYLAIMDNKPKRKKRIDDDEEWWTRWDRE